MYSDFACKFYFIRHEKNVIFLLLFFLTSNYIAELYLIIWTRYFKKDLSDGFHFGNLSFQHWVDYLYRCLTIFIFVNQYLIIIPILIKKWYENCITQSNFPDFNFYQPNKTAWKFFNYFLEFKKIFTTLVGKVKSTVFYKTNR